MHIHTIYITKHCNMMCSYCYERNKENRHFTTDFIYNTLHTIYDNCTELVCLEIIGGEPLLNWATFIDICKFNKLKGCSIVTTTNGTLLNNDIIVELKQYNVQLGISYDGKSSHDIYRRDTQGRGTEQKVRENILLSLEMGLDVNVNMTFQKANYRYIYNDIEELIDSGVKTFKIHTVNNNMFKVDKHTRYSIYNDLIYLAHRRNITIDLSKTIRPSIYEHYYHYGNLVKIVKKGEIGHWAAVGWDETAKSR